MKKISILSAALATGLSINAHATNTYVGLMAGIQDITTSSARFRGFRPGAFIGYGQMMSNDFYLAGELTGSFGAVITDSSSTDSNSVRTTLMSTIAILPGMMINNAALLYMRLGGAYARFSSAGMNLYGVVGGAGLEAAMTPDWSLRFEYDFTSFRSSGSLNSPKSDEMMLSLKYTFDV